MDIAQDWMNHVFICENVYLECFAYLLSLQDKFTSIHSVENLTEKIFIIIVKK